MLRRGGFFKIAFGRALTVLLLALAPIAAGPAVGPSSRHSSPPPPRFVPVRSDVHIIATWGPGGSRALQAPASANSGPDVTLLSKTGSAASVAADGTLHYSVSITNATNATQTFLLTDTLPASESYLTSTATGGFVYNAASASLTATRTLNAFSGDVITTTGAPPYTEISGSGQDICFHYFPQCDDNAITLAGVPFRYLGVGYTTITLDSNGFVAPGSADPGLGNQNQHLPDPAAPNNVIAPFWDDLDLIGNNPGDLGGGAWYYGVEQEANATYLVVEWHNAQKKGEVGTAYSFQVWVQFNAEHITFAYQSLTGTTSTASIGFENSDGTLGHSFLYQGTGSVPGPGAELQIAAAFDTAPLGYDVQVQHGLKGCAQITNVVNLSNATGSVAASAAANTSTFGPCLFWPLLAR